ncbi:O-methyltransferase family protein [Mycobacteroides abscessus]|nr:O-methyltransferase family protein [Mycobacteroides abscessus]
MSNEYLAEHPRATGVGTGRGPADSFWRIDNGELNWLSVDPGNPSCDCAGSYYPRL